MIKIAAPRGTADIYPPVSARWQDLEARAGAIARRFGYGEIRTPIFESTELFVRGVGETTDIVEKEMYTFLDKGGRSMTLRPEWTAPVVRAMLEHNLLAQGPQRLYYVGPFFRYERPQAGRYRQANQFGIECFGYAGPEADVEVMHVAYELLRAYRVPGVLLHVNSIGDDCCRPAYREALLAHFRPHAASLSADSQRRLERNPLRILDSKAPEDRELVASAPTFGETLCEACAAHFAGVCALLEAIGIPFVVEPRLVRGFDYYTRTVFEFISDALGAQSTVCGGGRYDDLVRSLGGPQTPAVGFGLGLERFLMVLEAVGGDAVPPRYGIAAIGLGAAARAELVPLVAALRATGDVPITIDYGDGKLQAHFKKADRANARAALILGDDERARGVVVARDLITREQLALGPASSAAALAELVFGWYRGLAPAASGRRVNGERSALDALLAIVREYDLDALTVRVGTSTYELVARPETAAAPFATTLAGAEALARPPSAPVPEPIAATNFKKVTAPIIGVFYRSPAPGSESFVELGDRVEAGQALCILEAMKLMNEITSDYSGVVRRILPENGALVSLGEEMFWIEP